MSEGTTVFPSREVGDGVFEVFIESGRVQLLCQEIIFKLGYAKSNIDSYFEAAIRQLIDELPGRLEIKAGFRVVSLEVVHPGDVTLTAGGVCFTTGKIVASQLRDAEFAAFFACTIGEGMEGQVKCLFDQGDAVLGHFADVIASEAAEQVAGLLHDHIEQSMAKNGDRVTNRYSPGYCGWSVVEQNRLFTLFPEGFCGISVSESSLMAPVKSVSGVVGIGKNVARRPYLCGSCGQNTCTYKAYADVKNRQACTT